MKNNEDDAGTFMHDELIELSSNISVSSFLNSNNNTPLLQRPTLILHVAMVFASLLK